MEVIGQQIPKSIFFFQLIFWDSFENWVINQQFQLTLILTTRLHSNLTLQIYSQRSNYKIEETETKMEEARRTN